MVWFDSHCHSSFENEQQFLTWLEFCRSRGVQNLLIAGVHPETDLPKVECYQRNQVHYSLGLHPWWVDESWEQSIEKLAQAMSTHKPNALGECGLDRVKNNSWTLQLQAFKAQLQLATQYQVPVVVHSVRSHSDVLALLNHNRVDVRGVVHGFWGSVQQAAEFSQRGFYLGK